MEQIDSCPGSAQNKLFVSSLGCYRLFYSFDLSLSFFPFSLLCPRSKGLLPVPCTGPSDLIRVFRKDLVTPRALAVALLCLCCAGQSSDCWQLTSPGGEWNSSGRAGTSEEIAPNCSHRAWRKRFDGFTEENGWEGIDKHTERSN